VEDGQRTLRFFYRNVLDCVRYLLRQIAYGDDLVDGPRCEYDQSGQRINAEMHTADWWCDVQVLPRSLFYVKVYQWMTGNTPARGDCGSNHWDVRSDESHQLLRRQESKAGLYDDRKSSVDTT